MPKTLRDIRCRCGHDQAQHQPNTEWCNGNCGCSYFEPLHQPDPPHTPTLVGPLAAWVQHIINTGR